MQLMYQVILLHYDDYYASLLTFTHNSYDFVSLYLVLVALASTLYY